MYIKSLHLENFRCYDRLELDFDKRLTVIVGDNGKGKTAVFDALAKVFEPYLSLFNVQCGKISASDARNVLAYDANGHIKGMQAQYPVVIAVSGSVGEVKKFSWSCRLDADGDISYSSADADSAAYARKTAAEVEDRPEVVLPVLGYYGTQRIWQDSSLLEKYNAMTKTRVSGYTECLEPTSSYNTFLGWLQKCKDPTLLAVVGQAMDSCLAHTGWSGLKFNKAIGKIVVSNKEIGELPITDALSDGARSVISMVADIAYRMVRLNPQLGLRTAQETPGMVLIDEVDMHLHPGWQQTVVSDLLQIFPKVQFIVTTHSPQVLSTVPAESIRILEWQDGVSCVRRPEFALGAESHQLLKEIQNVDTRAQSLPIVKQLKRYLELVADDEWDSGEAQELRRILNEWAKGREPALLRADMDIRLRKLRRNRP